jgi:hypothetical protein
MKDTEPNKKQRYFFVISVTMCLLWEGALQLQFVIISLMRRGISCIPTRRPRPRISPSSFTSRESQWP